MGTYLFAGLDIGGTSTKVAIVDGEHRSLAGFWQRSTPHCCNAADFANSQLDILDSFLTEFSLCWESLGGLCLALPGTLASPEVWGESPNFPKELWNTNMVEAFSTAAEERYGRRAPTLLMNDANAGGLAEAVAVQAEHGQRTTIGLFQGTGLGGSLTSADGTLQVGDHLAAAEFGHLQLSINSGVTPLPCGCGRPACIEPWVSLSGMDLWVPEIVARYQDHPLAQAGYQPGKSKYQIRDLARTWDDAAHAPGDPVARTVFETQARVLGQSIGQLIISHDASFVVLGGGLVDPDATSEQFRAWYVSEIKRHAEPLFWACQREVSFHFARFGDHSQALGAAINAEQTFG